MSLKNISVVVCASALLACFASTAFAQDRSKKPASPPAQPAQTSPTISAPANVLDHALFVDAMAIRGVKKSPAAVPAHRNPTGPSRTSSFNATLVSPAADPPSSAALPLWTFRVRSARDGNYYSGAMVGRNPFKHPGSVDVPTVVVPLVVKFHQIATAFDPNTGLLTTTSGETTFEQLSRLADGRTNRGLLPQTEEPIESYCSCPNSATASTTDSRRLVKSC